jgi:hypothetical protein
MPEPVNPYAAPKPTEFAGPPAIEVRSRIARCTRWWVRSLGALWLLCGIWLLADPLSILTHSSFVDEWVGLLSFLLCVTGGITLGFRWRWALWLGTAVAAIATTYSAFVLRDVLLDESAFARDTIFRTVIQWVVLFPLATIAGVLALWRIRWAQRRGVPYRWNPGEPSGSYEYQGRAVDGMLVRRHGIRWNRLGWSWIALGVGTAALVFPCLLILKEETQRVTTQQWTAAVVVQVIALCVGLGMVLLGIAVRRRSIRAARIGLGVGDLLLAINVANLAIPFSLFPDFVNAFPDMAFGLYVGLAGVGFGIAAYTHWALWSARKIERSSLPVSIRFEQLTEVRNDV